MAHPVLDVRSLVCINKYDLNIENTEKIENFCQANDIEVVGKIPFDTTVTEALVIGKPVVEYSNGEVSAQIQDLWKRIGDKN